MKFGKEFAVQMVQEWQEAYMDYNKLKTMLKDILTFKQKNKPPSTMAAATTETTKELMKQRASLYRAFSGLTNQYKSLSLTLSREDEVILVTSVKEEGAEGGYQTMFLRSGEEGGEFELLFFRRLDDEFNKVLRFYKKKVEEVITEADELSKQMNALIALRIKVDNPVVGGTDMVHLSDHDLSSNSSLVAHPIHDGKHGPTQMDVIQEEETSTEEISGEEMKKADGHSRQDPLNVLDHVKINVELESPVSILRSVIKSSKSDLLFGKQELRTAEEKISQAFVEFYRKLRLLKNYCFLNQLAFSKIMKKYDKVTTRNASNAYLQMVDESYLGSSVEVNKLLEKVEKTYVKHFANGNHRKGMKTLRPQAKKGRHRITFLNGFFSGCSIALIVAIIMNIHDRNYLTSQTQGKERYMVNIFPLYSLFGYIVLHMLMYAGNVYFWKRYRINYSFIFGFKQGTELEYREVLLLSSGLSMLTLAGVISHLDMDMDPRTKSFRTLTELIPLFLLTVVFSITFCPFNIIYRSNRFFLIRCIFHCVCAPLYKVTLADFFLADQLTSQVQAIRGVEFYICYYGWGNFRERSSTCGESEIYKIIYIAVAIIPYWIRFIQCVRRLFEEKDTAHGLNGVKYLSTIVAVVCRTIYQDEKTTTWLVFATVTSGIATMANLYWDIVKDWGLLIRNSTNPWLRDKIAVPHKWVYYSAMVLNCVLRLAWMQQVLRIQTVPFLHKTTLVAVVASLEIVRRGIWNFFRLENEHLNNVGKFRAFKSVPLPFCSDYNGDKSR